MEKHMAAAERVAKRRARIAVVLGILLMVQQVIFFRDGGLDTSFVDEARNVDMVRMIGWFTWVAILMLLLATGGGWLQSKEVRDLLNDESTRAHRHEAMSIGFWVMALIALILYLISMFEPIGEQLPLHVILTFGLASALIRFGKLERAALADG